MSSHNEDTVREYNEWRRDFQGFYNITLDYFGDLKNAAVVDFGCGEGALLKKCITRGAEYGLGLDVSDVMIQSCARNEDKQIRFIVQDCFKDFTVDYGKFDFAACLHVLNCCDSLEKMKILFKNIFASLKLNGKALIVAPSMATTVEDQQMFENLGMSVPLRSEAGDKDPFFAYTIVSAIDPANGTRRRLFRFPNYFWSDKKLIENLEGVGFVNVRRMHPKLADYQSSVAPFDVIIAAEKSV